MFLPVVIWTCFGQRQSGMLCLLHRNFYLRCTGALTVTGALTAISNAAGITAKVVIPDIEAHTFSLALSWIYGTIDMSPPLEQAVPLFVASDRLGLISLNKACAQIIECQLDSRYYMEIIFEVQELWEFAKAIGSEVVTQARNETLMLGCTSDMLRSKHSRSAADLCCVQERQCSCQIVPAACACTYVLHTSL